MYLLITLFHKSTQSINSISNKKQNYGIFYFPDDKGEEINTGNNNMIKKINMNKKIKISETMDSIIGEITKIINEKDIKNNLKMVDKISCFISYYLNEDSKETIIKEKIGYFDSLYSCIELKNKNFVELKVILSTDLFTFISNQKLVSRGRGYCKIFYSNNNDYIWKKCNVKSRNINNAKLIGTDYISKPLLNNDDVVLAFNFN